jgi:hypothetical protein
MRSVPFYLRYAMNRVRVDTFVIVPNMSEDLAEGKLRER